jgi:hypothetical protein
MRFRHTQRSRLLTSSWTIRFTKRTLEIAGKYQAFSKELVRLSLLGLAVYGFLIKLGTSERGNEFFPAMQHNKWLVVSGVVAFAICAGFALLHGFMTSQCLGHQLLISRYFGRLEGDRWDERHKEDFQEEIRRQQREQKIVLIRANCFLSVATFALIFGAALVALCSGLVLINR